MKESKIEGDQGTRLSSGGHPLVDFCGNFLFGLRQRRPIGVCGWWCRRGVVDAHVASLNKCSCE